MKKRHGSSTFDDLKVTSSLFLTRKETIRTLFFIESIAYFKNMPTFAALKQNGVDNLGVDSSNG